MFLICFLHIRTCKMCVLVVTVVFNSESKAEFNHLLLKPVKMLINHNSHSSMFTNYNLRSVYYLIWYINVTYILHIYRHICYSLQVSSSSLSCSSSLPFSSSSESISSSPSAFSWNSEYEYPHFLQIYMVSVSSPRI